MKQSTLLYMTAAGLCSCNDVSQKQITETEKDTTDCRRPNIVILLTDDQGYGDMRCYGNERVQTPNLDRLAAEGTRFINFYASAAASTPSRAGLLTGRYAERVGVPGVVDDHSENGIKPTEITLAEYLKQNDYATGMVGKWHLGYQPEYMPLRHGFTEFFGLPYSNDMWPYHPAPNHPYPALPLYDNDRVIEYNPPVNQMTTRLTGRAVKFINDHKDKPFFLYLPYTQPHVPLGVSSKFKGKSGEGLYADVLMEIDWSVGEIMKTLKANGLDDNTLVIFTSDNGPWLSYGNHGGSNGGLREGKGSTFDGGQRVPMIARMPGHIPAGKVSGQYLSALDITPTIVELTGSQMPRMNSFDGENVWNILTGGTQTHRPFYFVYDGKVEAVRDGKWKCVAPHKYRIVKTPGKDGLPGMQIENGGETGLALFDLEKDPQESNDISAQNPEITVKMYDMIQEFQKEMDREIENNKAFFKTK